MPLYEYQCDTCGTRFERIQKFSDPLVAICPKCAGPVRKLLSSPAIQFKGSGFYITDYAKAGSSDAAKVDAAKTEAKADAAPAETKPAESAAKSDSSPKADTAKPPKSAD